MANITLFGASYTDVPACLLPKTGGGTVRFTDTSPTTAGDSDVASGKIYFKADGSQSTGTASGGGGSSWTLLASSELAVNTTSTSAASAGTVALGSAGYTKDKIIWVHIRDKAGKRSGYLYGSDTFFVNSNKANGSTSTFSTPSVNCIRCNSDGTYTNYIGQYGVYGYSITSSGSLTVRRRYNSTYTLTINGTYVVSVYAPDLPTGITLFA